MAVRHADGFALYGTGATSQTNAVQGVYSQWDGTITMETTNPRAPGTHHARMANTLATRIVRRALGVDLGPGGMGFAAAHYFSSLPSANDSHLIMQGRDGSNLTQWSLTLTSTGKLQLRTGGATGTVVAESTDAAVTSGAYQHIEGFVVTGNAGSPGGHAEVRVKGQTVLLASNIDTQGQATSVMSQYAFGGGATTLVSTWDMTDLVIWDTTGAINNDFLADVICYPWRPNGDRAATDWVRNTGATDTSAISDTTPDGDTTYIEAASGSPDAVSEFDMGNAPTNASDIIAVITQPNMKKTDAGAGTVQVALLSGVSVHSGAAIPLTTTYTYYPEVHETDPATGVRWTPTGFNAAGLRLTRTI